MPNYAVQSDLTVPVAAFAPLSGSDLDKALTRASQLADSYLANVFDLPLVSWGEDLRGAVASVATYFAMQKRGFNPDTEDAGALRLGYSDAIKWLEAVAAGKATPVGVVDSSAGTENQTVTHVEMPFVVTGRPGAVLSDDAFWDGDVAVQYGGLGPPKPRGW